MVDFTTTTFGSSVVWGRSGRDHAVGLMDGPEGAEVLHELRRVVAAIGGLEFKGVLGEGAQGIVCHARHEQSGDVALKICRHGLLATDDQRRRFTEEADTQQSLSHPRIVRVLDRGIAEGYPWLKTEFVKGRTLDAWHAEEPGLLRDDMTWDLTVFRKLCEAVAFAHGQGIAHLDLNPRNILVDDRGEPHILDFGLARRVDDGSFSHTLIDSTTGGGTLPYIAPEQIAGKRTDYRADIYALGMILYHWVTLTSPFDYASGERLTGAILLDAPRPPSERFQHLSPHIEAVILKCLQKKPSRRYASVLDVLDDLDRAEAGRRTRAPRVAVARRRRAATTVLSLLTLAVLAFGVWGLVDTPPVPNLGTGFFESFDGDLHELMDVLENNRLRYDSLRATRVSFSDYPVGGELQLLLLDLLEYGFDELDAGNVDNAMRAFRAYETVQETFTGAPNLFGVFVDGIAPRQIMADVDIFRNTGRELPSEFVAWLRGLGDLPYYDAKLEVERDHAVETLMAGSIDGYVDRDSIAEVTRTPELLEATFDMPPTHVVLDGINRYFDVLIPSAHDGVYVSQAEFFEDDPWAPIAVACMKNWRTPVEKTFQNRHEWRAFLDDLP